MPHNWIPSTLGHGDVMCSRCFVTNLEAAALGIMNACDVPAPAPAAANEKSRSTTKCWTRKTTGKKSADGGIMAILPANVASLVPSGVTGSVRSAAKASLFQEMS